MSNQNYTYICEMGHHKKGRLEKTRDPISGQSFNYESYGLHYNQFYRQFYQIINEHKIIMDTIAFIYGFSSEPKQLKYFETNYKLLEKLQEEYPDENIDYIINIVLDIPKLGNEKLCDEGLHTIDYTKWMDPALMADQTFVDEKLLIPMKNPPNHHLLPLSYYFQTKSKLTYIYIFVYVFIVYLRLQYSFFIITYQLSIFKIVYFSEYGKQGYSRKNPYLLIS